MLSLLFIYIRFLLPVSLCLLIMYFRVARSPTLYERSRISDPFSCLLGGSHRKEQISRILLVRLSRHSDDTLTRKNFVQNYYMAHL